MNQSVPRNARPTPTVIGTPNKFKVMHAAAPPNANGHANSTKTMALHPDVEEVLLTHDEIQDRVQEVGKQIAADYADKAPVVCCTLKGATLFMSDLVRAIHPVPEGLEIQFIRASSYGDKTSSSGNVALGFTTFDVSGIEGRHILLVEDIVDSGRTASELTSYFKNLGAASVKMCSLLSKPARRELPYDPEYLLFTIPDKFVVGYGLDFAETLRTLPYVGVLKPEKYSSD